MNLQWGLCDLRRISKTISLEAEAVQCWQQRTGTVASTGTALNWTDRLAVFHSTHFPSTLLHRLSVSSCLTLQITPSLFSTLNPFITETFHRLLQQPQNLCLRLSFSPSLMLIPPSSFEKQQRDRLVVAASLLSAQLKFIILSNTLTLMVLWWAGLCSSSCTHTRPRPHTPSWHRCQMLMHYHITVQAHSTQGPYTHNIMHVMNSYILDAHMGV